MAPTILLVEDDSNLAVMLSAHLTRAGYVVQAASTLEAARALAAQPWDLAILDRHLPDGDGVDLCRELRAAAPYAYLIMLTGASSEEEKLEGFACGADDYITKPAPVSELVARVRAGLRIVALQKQLLELSRRDSLTSLHNRRSFDERFEDAFEQARRYHRPLALAVIDIDHFKRINDRSGHDHGDSVLRAVAQRIAAGTRQSDFAARLGGEEFAIVLPETALFEALQFGEKLRASIAAEPVVDENVTVSIGIASVPHSHVTNPSELFRAADQALYRAKENGRNRVEIERRRVCREAPRAATASA
ncbi:MAG TPA: diguanylate cyclase [Thermoanaerobaculia bacterium]